jgi:tol-pal system beta propeller repeat protein TolB
MIPARFVSLFCLMLLFILSVGTVSLIHAQDEEAPEVTLEAYGAGYYRPGLIYGLQLEPDLTSEQMAATELFDERLRFALDWSGYIDLLPVDSLDVVGPPETERPEAESELRVELGPADDDPALVYATLTLAEPGGDSFYSGRIAFKSSYAAESGDAAAETILIQLTGMTPPFRSRIVFVESRGNSVKELMLAKYDGSTKQQLTNDQSIALSPSWSPDAKSIVFCSFRDGGDADLFIADLAGRRIRRLATREGTDAAPSWSPTGDEIVFAGSNGETTSLYLVDSEGGNVRRLTSARGIDTSPSWSPTGREIVFMSDRNGNPHIYRMDRHGANLRRLTYEGKYNSDPSWSPSGERIVYCRRTDKGFQLHSMDPMGDVDVALTDEYGDHLDPSWSADGMKITYSFRDRIWVMSADGTNRRQLDSDGLQPDWSPILNR